MSLIGNDEKYHVMYFSPESPISLRAWLNKFCRDENLELVAVYGDFFIFQKAREIDNVKPVA